MKPGQPVGGLFAVSKFEARTSERAGRFGQITVSDLTGMMSAKIWGIAAHQEETIRNHPIVRLTATTNAFNEELQLIINAIEAAPEEDIRTYVKELIPFAERDVEEMYAEALNAVESISNPALRQAVRSLIADDPVRRDKFRLHPAAVRNHHAVVGGLLQHTCEILGCGMDFCRRDETLNRDILTAMIVLHDIGKTEEIEVDRFGMPTGFTKEGKLLGHIPLGMRLFADAARIAGVDAETLLVVEHGIYTHHGLPEWGSPIPPKIREAQLLHYLDNISAKNDQFRLAAKLQEDGTFTYDKGLQREVYRPVYGAGSGLEYENSQNEE
jgi:3'-5' exoribonuclease